MLPFFGTPVFGEVAEGSGVGLLPPPVQKKTKRHLLYLCDIEKWLVHFIEYSIVLFLRLIAN